MVAIAPAIDECKRGKAAYERDACDPFSRETARSTGKSERAVQRDAHGGEAPKER